MQKSVRAGLVVLFVIMSTWGICSAADVAKIGVLDFQKILEESSAGKSIIAEINGRGEEMKGDLEVKSNEIEELRKKLEREAMVMDRGMREEKEREIRIKINDLKSLQKKYRDDLKEIEARMFKRVQKDVFEIVEELGKAEGFMLIVERVGVLYYPESIDITDQVIELYNKQYAEKSTN